MTILEIILLAAGALLIAASFFFPEKEEASSIENIDALVREEVKASIEAESENMRRHVEDVVDEAVSYAEEKTERALERITNEKIMAVNEYSDTVLDEINKNHKEVMFLYDMLNDKQKNLKNTVTEASEAAKEVQKTTEELKSVSREVNTAPAEVTINTENMGPVKMTSQKAVNFFSGLEAEEAKATIKSVSEEEPVKEVRTLNWASLAVNDANEAEKKEAAKEGREPENVIEGPRERLNREVIELADSGMEPVEIARKLKMGVGEVGLILGLHGR
ncbi:MAG: hypothetical protein J6I66_01055 [Lachnospiraceae bacterium]|nr:hypothetical protein [Lachnospiraceae bacterium]